MYKYFRYGNEHITVTIPYTKLHKHSLNAKYTQLFKDKLRIRQFTPHFKALHTLLIFRTTECNLKKLITQYAILQFT